MALPVDTRLDTTRATTLKTRENMAQTDQLPTLRGPAVNKRPRYVDPRDCSMRI